MKSLSFTLAVLLATVSFAQADTSATDTSATDTSGQVGVETTDVALDKKVPAIPTDEASGLPTDAPAESTNN